MARGPSSEAASHWDRPDEEMTLGHVFADQVDLTPAAVAVIDGDREWTYRELDVAVSQLANGILAADPDGRHPHVGVLLGQSAEAAIAILAVARAARVAVMLDPATPPARIEGLVGKLDHPIVITDSEHRGALARCDPSLVVELDIHETTRDQPTTRPDVRADPAAAAGITFTSGSTGVPKGVMRSHRSLVAAVERQHREGRFLPGDRVALVFEYQFAAGRATIFGALFSGSTLDVFDVRRHGPAALGRWMAAEEVTNASFSSALAESLLDTTGPELTFPSLRRVTFTADVLRRRTVERLRARLSPEAVIMNLYGSSEAGGVARFTITADTVLEGELVPVGPVRDHVTVEIDDPDDQGVGEIVVTSTNVALGYLGQAKADSPFAAAADNRRTFRSGDLGRLLPDGTLEYRGRIDHRVKVRGHVIDPVEVQAAMLAVPGVVDAAVVLDPNEGRARLVGYVVTDANTSVSVNVLRHGLRDAVPAYMIPTAFVTLDALPRTSRGKLDRIALPAPRPGRPDLDTPYVAPRTASEQTVADIFCWLLDIDRVGRNDEFFALGGDSLAAAEAMTAMSAALGRDLPLAVFLEASTPAALAARFDATNRNSAKRLVTLQPDGTDPPIVCIHGGGGQVLSFASLADRLPHDRPFVALQMSARDRARRLFRTRHLARQYADEIQRSGLAPDIIAGHSYGGLLAVETTRRLVELGARVRACVLIDSPYPQRRLLLRRLITGHRQLGAIDGVDDVAWLKEMLYAAHALVGLRPKPHRLTTERMIAALWGAVSYRPQAIAVPLIVVHAGQTPADLRQWRTVALDGFELLHQPGDHQSILMPPQVDGLAAQLDAALRAEATSATGRDNERGASF